MMNEFADKIEVACMDAGLAVRCTGGTLTPRFVSYELVGASLAEMLQVSLLAELKLRQRSHVVICEVQL